MNFKKNNFYFYSLLIIATIFFIISLSQTLIRYNLNQQLAFSDRLLTKSENLYPSKKYEINNEVTISPYFPGIAIITTPINFILPSDKIKNLFYSLMALISHFLFIFILSKIHSQISGSKLSFSFFSVLIFSILITKSYTLYSLELKPDTLAFTTGLYALYFSKLKRYSKNNLPIIILCGFFFGLGLIFKQQYLSFIAGMFLFNFIHFKKKIFIFTLSALTAAIFLLFLFNKIPNIWFWTIETFRDDGFMSLNKYLFTNKFLIFNFILFFVIFINLSFKRIDMNEILNFINKFFSLFRNEYTWILIPAALSCFLSGYKVGGNSSNTGLGLLLLFPIIFSIVRDIETKWLKIFLIFGIINVLPFSLKSIDNLQSFYSLKSNFNKIELKKNDVVLYAPSFYTIVKNDKNIIMNDYWTDAQRKGITLSKSLLNNLEKSNFNYLLIESYMKDDLYKFNNNKFKILIENKIGILAKRTNY